MQIDELKKFHLVWGTNLALRYGHRISIDIDLFCQDVFNQEKLDSVLKSSFPSSKKIQESEQTLTYDIDGVKLDCINYPYSLIQDVEEIDDIRMVSVKDIIPMKLSAIARRGSRKDFYDIAMLLNYYSFDQMFDFFSQKYVWVDTGYILRSLYYFDDADNEPDIVSLNTLDREHTKEYIMKKSDAYLKNITKKI